jgi:hypothetical protein
MSDRIALHSPRFCRKGQQQSARRQNSSATAISPASFFGATARQLRAIRAPRSSQSLSPVSSRMPIQPSPN